jgi:hypothetical protein
VLPEKQSLVVTANLRTTHSGRRRESSLFQGKDVTFRLDIRSVRDVYANSFRTPLKVSNAV